MSGCHRLIRIRSRKINKSRKPESSKWQRNRGRRKYCSGRRRRQNISLQFGRPQISLLWTRQLLQCLFLMAKQGPLLMTHHGMNACHSQVSASVPSVTGVWTGSDTGLASLKNSYCEQQWESGQYYCRASLRPTHQPFSVSTTGASATEILITLAFCVVCVFPLHTPLSVRRDIPLEGNMAQDCQAVSLCSFSLFSSNWPPCVTLTHTFSNSFSFH